ncbi:hypothetical protein SO802_010271 [Lithocarpus litseifolius]|uniref:Uncharacterized protein n=1 Tax=Lithocarpus litseifolius TaxID=425828 RepID=A0AAW2DGT7_9ROSI
MITFSLYDRPVYFDVFPDICLALDDPNIVKALTLNVLTFGFDMDEGSKPFALIYRIYYRILGSQLNPRATHIKDPAAKLLMKKKKRPDLSPSASDFQIVETLVFQSQLRVLTALDASFEIDMVSLFNEFISTKNRDKRKYYQKDKTVVRSSHPPLEIVLVTCQKTEVKASPFKIADADIPGSSIIEQNNFTNEPLHVFGQQLDRIEEKIVEQTVSAKPEKPLNYLPSQREKIGFKTSQAKTLDIVEKTLSDLKAKTESTSNATCW